MMSNGTAGGKRSRSPAVAGSSTSAQAAAAAAAALFGNAANSANPSSTPGGLPASLALSLLSAHHGAAAAAAAVQQQQQQQQATTAAVAAAGMQDKRNRNPNWTDPEIIRFLEMLEEDHHVADMVANKNKKVFCEIAARLVSEGADKTWDQCRIKLKNLKSQYRYVKERIPYIDDLDLEDETVVKQLLNECQARAISPSSIKHLKFLLRFLNKLKMMTALSAAGEMKVSNASCGSRSTSSLSNQIPSASTRPTISQTTKVPHKDEGISPPSSPYPAPQILTNGDDATATTGGVPGRGGQEDENGSYKLIEGFNRDLMERFMEHQRKSRESFEAWEADRWRAEKEAIEKWKVESREHERQLFDMFCNAMVKCNTALTALLQSSNQPKEAVRLAASAMSSITPNTPQQHPAQAQPEARLASLIKRSAGSAAATINHEVTIKRIRTAAPPASIQPDPDEDDIEGDEDDEEEDEDDEAYEMQQEIQNMVQVTMDVQDSEIVQC